VKNFVAKFSDQPTPRGRAYDNHDPAPSVMRQFGMERKQIREGLADQGRAGGGLRNGLVRHRARPSSNPFLARIEVRTQVGRL